METTTELPTLTLHGARTGNSFRAAIALEAAGLAYRVQIVDLGAGEHRRAPFIALNPVGQVPVLEIGDAATGTRTVLTQSNAIALYAADCAPGRLLPTEPRSRQRAMEAWFAFLSDAIAPNHAAFALRGSGEDAAIDALRHRSLAAIENAERFLGEEPWMAGNSFSLADIAGFTIAQASHDDIDWEERTRLRAWYDQASAHPAIVKGLRAFDPR